MRGYTFSDWGWRVVVSKPIITIYSKDDLPRPSPSSPRERGSGPPPTTRTLMKFRGPRSPGTAYAATSAALAHSQGDRSGHLINASPMSYPFARETSAASPGAQPGFVRNV